MAAISSKEAAAYLIDPLTAPEPSAETGLNSHFVLPKEPVTTSPRSPSSPRSIPSSNNPYRHSIGSTHSRHRSTGGSGDHKFPDIHENAIHRGSHTPPSYEVATGRASPISGRPRRSSSLRARFPGDESHKPLDLIRKDSKRASRAPHLSKRQMVGTDSIDRLDPAAVGGSYHHEGPYDAAALSRNLDETTSPLAALKISNSETIKATPVENVKDSIDRHKPLVGTAQIPPGAEDRFGRKYEYETGENLMIDLDPPGGAYKRYPGLKYHPDDIKGKGEPSYSQDIAEKAHEKDARKEGHDGIEMTSPRSPRSPQSPHSPVADASGRPRSGSFKEGLKRRIGSLRRKNHNE